MITLYKKLSHRLFRAGCGCAAALAGLFMAASCSDTWDEHYDSTSTIVQEGSLWQAIKGNASLSNFASVLEACGFDKSLNSTQVFTVFAPTNDNLSAEETAELIAQYNEEKKLLNDEDNTVIKEFVYNHIALYNFSVSSTTQDTLTMMNGKYVVLSSGKIGNATFDAANREKVQVMDGIEPTIFFDMGDYLDYLCPDASLLSQAKAQLDKVVPYKRSTGMFYSTYNEQKTLTSKFSGITISDPTNNSKVTKALTTTAWWKASH